MSKLVLGNQITPNNRTRKEKNITAFNSIANHDRTDFMWPIQGAKYVWLKCGLKSISLLNLAIASGRWFVVSGRTICYHQSSTVWRHSINGDALGSVQRAAMWWSARTTFNHWRWAACLQFIWASKHDNFNGLPVSVSSNMQRSLLFAHVDNYYSSPVCRSSRIKGVTYMVLLSPTGNNKQRSEQVIWRT